MGQSAVANALKRKTSVGQRAREVQGLTPTRAIRIALARAAGDLWELPLSVTSVDHALVNVESLLERFDDAAMTLLLDGPDGVRGGMTVDRALLTSVTEVQTIGAVTERPPGDRPFTPTDAALFAPLVDAMLERVDVALNADHDQAACERSEAAWALGYRFGAKVERKRNLLLAFEGEEFHLLRLDIDIAAGMRQGVMVICLPTRALPEVPEEDDHAHEPGAHADALATVPTRLGAVLPQVTLPLAQASRLAVGDLLPMPQEAIQNILLRASDGRIIARGKLGRVGELRALRLHSPRGSAAKPPAEAHAALAGIQEDFSEIEALRADDPDPRFVAHQHGTKDPQSTSMAATPPNPDADLRQHRGPLSDEEDLPDLPPMDFDSAFDDDGALPDGDIGNANFE